MHAFDDIINQDAPVDPSHPNFKKNLTPLQIDEFLKLANVKGKLKPQEAQKLDALKDRVVHGEPLELQHPGFDNLTPR